MQRFMIEVPHEAEKTACIRAIKILQETGSHYLTNADYGCMDGIHKAWIVVEVGSKEEARNILPRAYRQEARVVALSKFSIEEIQELFEQHVD